ncbi:MAG: DUF4783 domain-containing protein [Bacteroidia bacterium]
MQVTTCVWVGVLWLGCSLFLQGAERTLAAVEEGLRRGDAAQVARYFAPQVEIYIQGTARLYSDVQAHFVLREFFQRHPPRTFTLLHKGRSDQMLYGIGSYISLYGRWDVSFFTRLRNGRYQIEQLRFEAVED